MTRRVAALVAFVTFLAIGAFGIPTAIALYRVQRRALRLELKEEAFLAASSLRPDDPAVMKYVAPIPGDDHHRVSLYDATGRRLSGDGPAHADEAVLRAFRDRIVHTSFASEEVAAVQIPRPGGSHVVLRVAEDASDVSSNLDRQFRNLALAAVAVLALAVALGAWLSNRLTRPIRELRLLAQRVGHPGTTFELPSFGISELDDLGETLVRAAERVDTSMERERAFSAHVAHQLRTPIAAARVALEAELAAPREVPALALREVLGTVERLESTTTQLLTLARGVAAEHRHETDASEIVRDAQRRWAVDFTAAGRRIQAHTHPVSTSMQPAALTQIVDVLVENSLRHGHGVCTVRLAAGHAGSGPAGTGVLSVRDEGSVVGDPFARSTTPGGIGLRFATTLAAAEHASLVLGSRSPTRFDVYLPEPHGDELPY